MTMKLKLVWIITTIALTVFLLESCKQSPTGENPVPIPQDISAYLPLKTGNVWTYRMVSSTERADIQKRILDSVRHADGTLLYAFNEDVQVNNPPANPPATGYNASHDGEIHLYYSASDPLASPYVMLKGPILFGTSWLWRSSQLTDTLTIESIDPGSFNGVPIDTVVLVVRRSAIARDSSWYGRGVGLLKRRLTSWVNGPGTNFYASWDLEDYTLR